MPSLVQSSTTHQSYNGTGAPSPTTYTFSTAPAVGNCICVVGAFYQNNSSVPLSGIVATDNQGVGVNTYTTLFTPTPYTWAGAFLIYCANIRRPVPGPFVLSLNTGTAWVEFDVAEFSGVSATGPVRIYNTGVVTTTSTTATSLTISTTGGTGASQPAVGDTLLGVLCNGSNLAQNLGISNPPLSTQGVSYTSLGVQQTGSTNVAYQSAFGNVTTAGAQDIRWNFTTNTFSNGILASLQSPSNKRIRCLVKGTARTATNVVAEAFLPGNNNQVTGTRLGEFRDLSFQPTLDSNGNAVLLLPASDGTLTSNVTNGQKIVVTVRGNQAGTNYGTPFYFTATVEAGAV